MPDKSPTVPAITGAVTYNDALFRLPLAVEAYKVPIFSYLSSMAAIAVGFPLDSVKTRMQTHQFDGAIDCFRRTINAEGTRGLFRGIAAPLVSASCSRSIGVTMFTYAKPKFSEFFDPIWGNEPLIDSSKTGKDIARVINNIPVSFLSGATAGAVVSSFACPFELTKIFQQIVVLVNSDQTHVKKDRLPTKLFDVARSIVSSEGFRGLYLGFQYHIVRDSICSGLYYGGYETAKMALHSLVDRTASDRPVSDTLKTICVPIAGACAGLVSWITVYPLDTVKSRYQRDVVGNIVRSRTGQPKIPVVPLRLGLPTRDVYKGLGPSVIRSIMTTTIFFSLFEALMRNIA